MHTNSQSLENISYICLGENFPGISNPRLLGTKTKCLSYRFYYIYLKHILCLLRTISAHFERRVLESESLSAGRHFGQRCSSGYANPSGPLDRSHVRCDSALHDRCDGAFRHRTQCALPREPRCCVSNLHFQAFV